MAEDQDAKLKISAEVDGPQFEEFDYGQKTTFSTTGTPFVGGRYVGPENIPYTPADPSSGMPFSAYTNGSAFGGGSGSRRSGSVAEDPGPFQQAKAQASALIEDLQNAYTLAGRFPEIGVSPAYKADAASTLFVGGFGPEPPTPETEALTGAYADKRRQEASVLDSLRNIYSARGDYAKIGGDAFQGDLLSARVEAGLADAPAAETDPGFWGRIKGNLTSPHARTGLGFGIGYSAMAFGSGVAQYESQANSGQYVSPEQRSTLLDNAVIPGVSGILGTVIGEALGGPAGGLLGQFAGGAAGQALSSVMGAGNERDQATREAAERLANSLGAAASSIDTFRTQIDATGAPVQQLAQGLQSLQGFGPGVGSAAIAGAGRMALAENQDYVKDTQAVGGFLGASPGRYQMLDKFTTSGGELTGQEYRGIARDALFDGDYTAYNAAQAGAAAVRVKDDPQAQAAELEVSHDSNGPLAWAYDAEDKLGISNKRSQSRIVLNNEQAKLATDDGTTDDRQYSLDVGAARLALIRSTADVQGLQSGYDIAAARGGSAGDLAALLPGIGTSVGKAVGADQSLIGLLDPKNPDDALKIARLQDDQSQRTLGLVHLEQSNVQQGLGERDAAFRLGNLTDTLHGLSNAQQAPKDTEYFHSLITEAHSLPFLDPTQRATLESEGRQGVYAVQKGVFTERLDENSANTAAAGVEVTRAQSFGGPSEVAAAQTQVLHEYMDRIRELTQEIGSGTLTVADRIAAERQLSEARGGAISLQAGIARGESLGVESIAGTMRDTAHVGLDALIARSGSAGLPSATMLAADQQALTAAQGIVTNTPQEAADKALSVRQAQYTVAQDTTLTQTYQPSAVQATQLDNARTQFEISQVSPFVNGTNPITATQGLEQTLQAELSDARRRDKSVNDPTGRAQEANSRYENGLSLQLAQIEGQRETFGLGLLPETIAGLPGAGFGAAAVPVAGVSAFFAPNSRVSGSFGGGPATPTPMEGGAVGGFDAAHGINAGQGINGAQGVGAIVAAIQKLGDKLDSAANRSHAPVSNTGAVVQGQNNSYHPALRQ